MSWKHQDTNFTGPLTFEQKVEVFYEQTLGWQLHIADLIANGGTTLGENNAVPKIRHSGFAVLHICLSYFELIGSLVSLTPLSDRKAFEAGVKRVLPELVDGSADSAAMLVRLYEGARCGLYHEGRARPGIGLGQPPDGSPIAYDPESGMIGISPERLPQALKAHLDQFRRELLDQANAGLRQMFEHRFDDGFAQPVRKRQLTKKLTNSSQPGDIRRQSRKVESTKTGRKANGTIPDDTR